MASIPQLLAYLLRPFSLPTPRLPYDDGDSLQLITPRHTPMHNATPCLRTLPARQRISARASLDGESTEHALPPAQQSPRSSLRAPFSSARVPPVAQASVNVPYPRHAHTSALAAPPSARAPLNGNPPDGVRRRRIIPPPMRAPRVAHAIDSVLYLHRCRPALPRIIYNELATYTTTCQTKMLVAVKISPTTTARLFLQRLPRRSASTRQLHSPVRRRFTPRDIPTSTPRACPHLCCRRPAPLPIPALQRRSYTRCTPPPVRRCRLRLPRRTLAGSTLFNSQQRQLNCPCYA